MVQTILVYRMVMMSVGGIKRSDYSRGKKAGIMVGMTWWSNLSEQARRRWLVAVVAGVVSGVLNGLYLQAIGQVAADFTWAWRGAGLWLGGVNPYQAIQPIGAYPFDDWLYYPFPALLAALPLAGLPGTWAGAVFVGLSTSLLMWALLNQPNETPRDTVLRVGLTLCSAPFLFAWMRCQWSIVLAGAVAAPALAWLWLAKPNVGLPMLVAHFSGRRLAWLMGALAFSLALFPTWPLEMAGRISTHVNTIPAFTLWGWTGLAALWHWRTSAGRLLAAQTLMPQRLVYDQLTLWLMPRTWRQALALSAGSWLGLGLVIVGLEADWVMAPIHLAALGVLFWQTRPTTRRPDEPTTLQT